jgi:hypothetical protein
VTLIYIKAFSGEVSISRIFLPFLLERTIFSHFFLLSISTFI